MTDASQTPPNARSAPQDPHLDRLAQLHRMSRTAGVGSSEYAAVNTLSVIAAVLGLASALALMHEIFILVTCVPGIILAVAAIVQIRQSNGTQTGMPLAILGLAACLAFGGAKGFKQVQSARQQVNDQEEIALVIADFGKRLGDNDYAGAYAMTDPQFQARVPLTRFQALFTELRTFYGPMPALKPSQYFDWQQDPTDSTRRQAQNQAVTGLPAMRHMSVVYRFDGQKWTIYNLPELFNEQQGQQQQQQQQEQQQPPPNPLQGPTLPFGPPSPAPATSPSPLGPLAPVAPAS
jgi:hypothetical protein